MARRNSIGFSSAKQTASFVERKSDSWKEESIDVPWGTIQGKWWGNRDQQPILALHGWQDNCGSFDRLCPLMPPEIPVLCIDLPGHGKSSPYPKGMQYYFFWDGICLIRRIILKYGWKRVTLMGHSLGGCVTFMYAASFPNEVEKLINIDMAGPMVLNLVQTVKNTGSVIDKFLEYESLPESKIPCYSPDQMLEVVLEAYEGSIDTNAARILMKRGMKSTPKHSNRCGYQLAQDLRIKISVLGILTEEQVLAYGKNIRCEVLNIRGNPGMTFENVNFYDEVIETLKQNAKLVVYERVPGTHHLHLVNAERVAPHINQFLLRP